MFWKIQKHFFLQSNICIAIILWCRQLSYFSSICEFSYYLIIWKLKGIILLGCYCRGNRFSCFLLLFQPGISDFKKWRNLLPEFQSSRTSLGAGSFCYFLLGRSENLSRNFWLPALILTTETSNISYMVFLDDLFFNWKI